VHAAYRCVVSRSDEVLTAVARNVKVRAKLGNIHGQHGTARILGTSRGGSQLQPRRRTARSRFTANTCWIVCNDTRT